MPKSDFQPDQEAPGVIDYNKNISIQIEGISLEAAFRELTDRPLPDTAFVVWEASQLAVRMGKDRIEDICLGQSLKALRGEAGKHGGGSF